MSMLKFLKSTILAVLVVLMFALLSYFAASVYWAFFQRVPSSNLSPSAETQTSSDGQTYTDPMFGYSVTFPSHWSVVVNEIFENERVHYIGAVTTDGMAVAVESTPLDVITDGKTLHDTFGSLEEFAELMRHDNQQNTENVRYLSLLGVSEGKLGNTPMYEAVWEIEFYGNSGESQKLIEIMQVFVYKDVIISGIIRDLRTSENRMRSELRSILLTIVE